jgi:hypothetical protein
VSAKSEDGERRYSLQAEPAQTHLTKEPPGHCLRWLFLLAFKSNQRRFRTSGFVLFSLSKTPRLGPETSIGPKGVKHLCRLFFDCPFRHRSPHQGF